jgi:hypothetical protein
MNNPSVKHSHKSSQNQSLPPTTFFVSKSLPPTEEIEEGTLLMYVISREEIEQCDTSRFLENFGLNIDPSLARKLMGSVMFIIDGFDDVDLTRKFTGNGHAGNSLMKPLLIR